MAIDHVMTEAEMQPGSDVETEEMVALTRDTKNRRRRMLLVGVAFVLGLVALAAAFSHELTSSTPSTTADGGTAQTSGHK